MYKANTAAVSYDGNAILQQLNLTVVRGESLVVLGSSGCGKSTLLNQLSGLSGKTHWQGEQPQIGYLFQEPRLLPWRTVLQNLTQVNSATQARAMLKKVKLEGCEDLFPSQISLGMARRVALARCLLTQPELILMDEPLASLDMHTATEMEQLISELVCSNPAQTLIYVTHNIDEALNIADSIAIIKGKPGQIEQTFRTDKLSKEELIEKLA